MSLDHDHLSDNQDFSNNAKNNLIIVFVLTTIFMVIEVTAGIIANSLALLADAGHMLSDVMSLALSVFAIIIAQKPRNTRYTFGYYRAEILAALFNGFSLIVISGYIVVEAVDRINSTEPVRGPLMLIAATIGLLVNIYGVYTLRDHTHENLNVSSAFFHIVADLLGSVAAILASIMIIITGNPIWDVLISVAITILILISGGKIIRKAVRILMQRAPEDINIEQIERSINQLDDVLSVHDLHIWAIDQEKTLLTAHIEVAEKICQHDRQEVMRNITSMLKKQFQIHHSTIQIEHQDTNLNPQKCGCM